MRRLRFLLISLVSFITIAVGTIFIPGSFLNRVILVASCGIFSFNSAFCTPNLEINSDQAMAFDSLNTNRAEGVAEGHRGITLEALRGDVINGHQMEGWTSQGGEAPLKDPKYPTGANLNFTGTAQREIERANRGVDLKPEFLDIESDTDFVERWAKAYVNVLDTPFSGDIDQSYKHFDRESFPEGSQWLIDLKTRINTNLSQVTNGNDPQQQHAAEARRLLGAALHTVQDFYAHTNWVELGFRKQEIDKRLGRQTILKPSNADTSERVNDDDIKEAAAFISAVETAGSVRTTYSIVRMNLYGALIRLIAQYGIRTVLSGHTAEEVATFVSKKPDTLKPEYKNNKTDTTKLTSGYFMGISPFDSCMVPRGKTRHGSIKIFCSGLNKDHPGRTGYNEAAELAVNASRDYIHQIIDPLAASGEFEAIKALMGMSTQPTQIDLTGTWIENASVTTIDNRGCTLGYAGNFTVDGQGPQGRVFALRQSGNQLTFPTVATTWGSGSGTQSYQGTVSGNRVTYIISGNAGGGFTFQFTGIISDDGNRVSGEGICRGDRGSATANVTFAWVRQVAVSLAGTWQSDWGPVVFNSNLTGYWKQGGGTGQIQSGTYDPQSRRLVFRYYQPWNDMNGTATLTLSQDGNQLSGTWTQQRGANSPGSGGSGTWTMRRRRSQ
jgi:hypothetical protein